MRALLDANVYISFLLAPTADRPIAAIVRAGIAGRYELVISRKLLAELIDRVENKPYLSERIERATLNDLVRVLDRNAVHAPSSTGDIPAISRDSKDDYLIVDAVLSNADFLVTGDGDLLILDPLNSLHILSPRAFLTLIEQP
ncbi:MAG: putative toxin-antitoxin system toxin component, PIN family [Caldilineaceae bacterium]|nr:putative toxin-antitoxin system toxin component, PIN family [Caldilineaceae bacterium]MBP8109337.1 putative toxin-antitoxin system toxin component, PIN family [Caldilineaceae bacterium]MBP8124523.1 putative toxin-antitoxin system toxin component, PIN family [Caldilineaceae bacterium]MBP9074516.1 putative toxin-antitoxin system toxin component, PIN family [Caldilineaceae bacterium]